MRDRIGRVRTARYPLTDVRGFETTDGKNVTREERGDEEMKTQDRATANGFSRLQVLVVHKADG